jgi:alpha-galactosidase
MQISYRHYGNHLVFERNNSEIGLLGLFTEHIWPREDLKSGSTLQMQLTGEVRPFRAGKRGLGSLPGERMMFVSMIEDHRYHGKLIVLILKDPVTQVLAEINYLLCAQSPTIRTWVRVRNDSTTSVGLEWVCSAILHNLATGGSGAWYEKTYVHVWDDELYGEGQWRRLRMEKSGLVRVVYPGFSPGQQIGLGSGYNQTRLSMGMLEDVETKTVWYWQIEHSGGWHWEIGEDDNGQLYLLAGGPDNLHHGYWKELKPGESFHSVPVALGCVQGGGQEALAALTCHYRNLIRGASAAPYCSVASC